ncbi:MAG: cyclase family protein [Gemmatimonadetes bacterium]|nr:cyclase family protein [Gemmatimonadota bacterium]MDA1102034.1 cyclase family protein [Gemmatimonadota bacterium]
MSRLFKRCLLFACAGVHVGCAPPPPEAVSLASLFADEISVVDLTHAVSANAPYWPGSPTSPFEHDTLSAHADGAPSMAAYAVPEHFGTHFDAPVHGGMGLPSIDRIPTAELFGPAVIIDVRRQVALDEDYEVRVEDIRGWEASHGPIPSGAIVLMRSGWAPRWSQGSAYYNRAADGSLHFPGFGADAARWLVQERDIAGIGVDTGSVDRGNARGFPVHGIVNGSGRYHLENLADLSSLPEAGAYLIVAPIKIEGGSGGQVRVFAVIPDRDSSDPSDEVRPVSSRQLLSVPEHPDWSESAPDTFLATFETTRGDFTVEVVRAWAPIGADRFYNLIRHGYYDDLRFHRVVPDFITQWGVSGDPDISAVWYDRGMPDDPVVESNVRGTIAFAFTEPGTRSTQVFVSMVDNSRLDEQGFPPFGRVIEGMERVVDSIYSGYGENSGGGVRRGDQSRIVSEGNVYLDSAFPSLDRLIRTTIR